MSETQERYELFQYDACPFCYRVRQVLNQAGINVPIRDVLFDRQARDELVRGGGRGTVPCLKIVRGDQIEWLYESLDIIQYLKERTALG